MHKQSLFSNDDRVTESLFVLLIFVSLFLNDIIDYTNTIP